MGARTAMTLSLVEPDLVISTSLVLKYYFLLGAIQIIRDTAVMWLFYLFKKQAF